MYETPGSDFPCSRSEERHNGNRAIFACKLFDMRFAQVYIGRRMQTGTGPPKTPWGSHIGGICFGWPSIWRCGPIWPNNDGAKANGLGSAVVRRRSPNATFSQGRRSSKRERARSSNSGRRLLAEKRQLPAALPQTSAPASVGMQSN